MPPSARLDILKQLFGGRFGVSYAIKANPCAALLAACGRSSRPSTPPPSREVRRAMGRGMPAERISFSGPAKRR